MKHLFVAIAAFLLMAAAPDRTQIYHGGPILTMEGDEPEMVEAIAVKSGKIVALGKLKSLEKKYGRSAQSIDLKGRTMLPGFIDAHGHISSVGQLAALANLSPPPVGGVDSIAKLQQTLRDYKAPPGMPIIIGWGYDDSLIEERRHPTKHDLDAVIADKPVLTIHASGHLAVANSAMLKLFGIDADTDDPDGGIIRREDDGKTPNGVLEETAFFGNMAKIAPSSPEAGVQSILAGAKIYAASGVTTAQDGRVMPESWAAITEIAKRDILPIDVIVLMAGEREWSPAALKWLDSPAQGRVRVAGIKLALDGSPQGRTAWLRDPVPVPPDGAEEGYRGYPLLKPERLTELLKWVADNDWQLFAHVNGDAAAQALIDGVRENGLAGKRTVAIHNQVVGRDQLPQMKELDIHPSFFANHTFFWGDWHREVSIGQKRADFISPQKTAWAEGLTPTAHNDSPVVPTDMMRLIWSSVNRRTRSGDILGPLERISPYRALQQVTINAAWQIREENSKGSIEVGKRADLVVLDRNPLAVEKMALKDITVVATIKDGKIIHGALDNAQ